MDVVGIKPDSICTLCINRAFMMVRFLSKFCESENRLVVTPTMSGQDCLRSRNNGCEI